jgi:hypothetical protein
MKPVHRKHTVDDEARNREAALDRTIEESFPASDPPSSIPNPDDDQHDVLDHVDDMDRRIVRTAVTPSPDRATDVKPRGEQRREQ